MVNNYFFVRERQLPAAHGRHTTINHIDVYKRINRTEKRNVIDIILSEKFRYQIGNS